MQFLTNRISVLGILYVSNIQIVKNLCFLDGHASPLTQWVQG